MRKTPKKRTEKAAPKPVAAKAKKISKGSRLPKKQAVAADLAPGVAQKNRENDQHRAKLLAKAAKGTHGRYVKLLLNLRDQLLDDIDFMAGDNLKRTQRDASSDLSAYSVHMADAGTDNFDREFALSMVSNEQEALYEIEDAIKRLENNLFGQCEMCAKPIPKPRLDAIPFARHCVVCQTEFEKMPQKRQQQTFALSDLGNSEEETTEKEEED